MRRLMLLLLVTSAATAVAAERGPWNEVNQAAIQSHVEFLASDLLEGRATASRGYDIAASYVAAQFRQAGLLPGGDDDTFYETVPLLEATPVLPGSSARLVREDDTLTFEYGTHYLPSADFLSASSTLSAPLVFAGYGIDAPELEHDDFQGIDLKGRIAVVFSGAPEHFSHYQRAYYSWTGSKWPKLAERGAVGVITVDSPADAKRVPWQRRVAMSWIPQMRWLDGEGQPQQVYPELKLRFHFNHEAATRLFEGAEHTFQQALATAEAGQPQGFTLPGMLTLSATTGLRRSDSTNVLGILPGTDAQLKDEYIVLTAHLDHLGRGATVAGDSIYNGAHDNAVGVAMLLEIARSMQRAGIKPRRSVLFAAVTAEEKGLLGSDFLVEHAAQRGRRLVAGINMDMPLVFAPLKDFVALGAEHSTLGTLARQAASATGYRLSPDATPEQVSFIRSDQFSFIRRGIPALVVKGGYEGRDPAIDLQGLRERFLAAHYHQPSDDLSLPMDYPTVADLARINLRILLNAAHASTAPRWQPDDFFAGKFQVAP